jgi:hypothetical protein
MEYPNSGALWPNKFKTKPADPNLRGTIKMERALLKELMASSDDELIEIQISAWTQTFKDGKYLAIRGSKPYQKDAPKQSQDDDSEDIPFN